MPRFITGMTPTGLITGGSGGIGRAICETLPGDWNVAVHYHTDEDAALDVVDAIKSTGTAAQAYWADLADQEATTDLVGEIVDDFGRLDGVVNNAGVFYDAALEEYDREMYERTFGVNVDGAIHCTRAALDTMKHNDPIDGAGDVSSV